MNTFFFHWKATLRKQRNHINSVKDSYGNWTSNDQQLGTLLLSYFSALFDSEEINLNNIYQLHMHPLGQASYAMLRWLLFFTTNEIKNVV